ncbi:LYR motif-containing protein 2 [Holothuria leucospilota]|uniref:LYR motif-containing protein 2 n=1 Tax=Holothuria leucospilota TaxID=206669 RepID=A0A9Q1BIV8_HOLLE|nr:LYR motif-containing protein 2 [Holothuria leucospilota]
MVKIFQDHFHVSVCIHVHCKVLYSVHGVNYHIWTQCILQCGYHVLFRYNVTITYEVITQVKRIYVRVKLGLVSHKLTTKMASIKLGAFSPAEEKWSSYCERLEQYFIVNDLTVDKKQVAVLIAAMGSKTYSVLKDLASPRKPSDIYKDIVDKLRAHFSPMPPAMGERFRFYARKQTQGESVNQYLAELKRLASTCNFDQFLNEALRDAFVFGLRDEHAQRRLFAYDDKLTLENAFSEAVSLETASAINTAMVRGPASQTSTVNALNMAQLKCFCGGKRGHVKRECRYRNAECKECGRRGHLASQCRSRERSGGEPKRSDSKKNKKKWDSKVNHMRDKEEVFTSDEGSDSDNPTSDGQSSWPVYTIKVAHETGYVNKPLMAKVKVPILLSEKPVDISQDFHPAQPFPFPDPEFLLRQQVISLYRDAFKTIRTLEDSNQRQELAVWTREEFKRNKNEDDEGAIKLLLMNGRQTLKEMKQAISMAR